MSEALEHTSPVEIVGRFLSRAPIDLYGIAGGLGLGVRLRHDWPDSISGSITRDGPQYIVTLNGHHAAARQRFTFAHEIGHCILHRDLIGDGITDDGHYRSGQPGYIESEANTYAANILMPAKLMRQAWIGGRQSRAQIAELFAVSQQAAGIRLQTLGLPERPASL